MAAQRPDSAVPVDDLGEPRFERPCAKLTIAEVAAERAGHQHRGFGHADHREVEQLARAAEARIAEGGDDGRIEGAAPFRQHLQHAWRLPMAASARVAM